MLDRRFIYIGIRPDDLDERIRTRLEKRFSGMIREGKQLHTKGLSYKRMYELGLEYRYIAMYLQGKLNKLDMLNEVYKEIRRYSKRQMSWFKRNKRIKFLFSWKYFVIFPIGQPQFAKNTIIFLILPRL